MRRAYHLIPILWIGLTTGCTHLQQARDTHLGNEPVAAKPSPASGAKSERGTPDEAKAMLEKAIEHYNSVGRKQALADFTAKTAPFSDRDLYVFCLAADGRTTANGGFPQYVGTSADAWKDADGKPLGHRILEAGTGQGSVDYRWINPVNLNLEHKTAFAKKVGEDVCGVGAYNPQ